MKNGDPVWFRGKYAQDFTIRGTIEAIEDATRPDHPDLFGIRLENGNFEWATFDQIKPRVCSEGDAA